MRIALPVLAVSAGTLLLASVAAAEPTPQPSAAAPAAPQAKALIGVTARPALSSTSPAASASIPIPEPVKLSADPRPTLGPGTFVATMNAAERYRAIAEGGGWKIVPADVTLRKPGERTPSVAALRARLAATGDLPPEFGGGDALDEVVSVAIRRFQDRHGLPETGLVGPRTLTELNIPVETRLRQLQASAARLLGSSFPFGERYVAVNIPAATVEAVSGGTVARRYVAIVGRAERASPTIAARVQNVNFNPTWTVPVSLVRKDIIPHMRQDPGYLAKMRIRILDGQGSEVSPSSIDWSTEKAVNYTLRQDPGPENSLGEIRIDMPNKLAVYMHDTPSKRLFARNARLQSSGCVRVAGVRELAAWLLEGTPGPSGPGSVWGAAEIAAAVASGQRQDVKLAKHVPVIWTYLTGYASGDGTVHFREDVYGLDSVAPPPPGGEGRTMDQLVTGALGERRP